MNPCDHGCGRESLVIHADGRVLCRVCYQCEVGMDGPVPGCPTCGPSERGGGSSAAGRRSEQRSGGSPRSVGERQGRQPSPRSLDSRELDHWKARAEAAEAALATMRQALEPFVENWDFHACDYLVGEFDEEMRAIPARVVDDIIEAQKLAHRALAAGDNTTHQVWCASVTWFGEGTKPCDCGAGDTTTEAA